MWERIKNGMSRGQQMGAERSLAATFGVLGAIVVCAALAILSGREPLTLDWPMIFLHASALPLGVFVGLRDFVARPPKLPILATLWFTALFLPTFLFGELFFGQGFIDLWGTTVGMGSFVGFRLVIAAVLAGFAFMAVNRSASIEGKEPTGARAAAVASMASSSIRYNFAEERSRAAAELAAFDALLERELGKEHFVLATQEVEEVTEDQTAHVFA